MAVSYHFQQFAASVIVVKIAIRPLPKVLFANEPPSGVADVYDIVAQLAAPARREAYEMRRMAWNRRLVDACENAAVTDNTTTPTRKANRESFFI